MILSKTPHKLGCVTKNNPISVRVDISRSEFVKEILFSVESNHKLGIELSCFELSADSINFPDFCVVEENEPENDLLEKLTFIFVTVLTEFCLFFPIIIFSEVKYSL